MISTIALQQDGPGFESTDWLRPFSGESECLPQTCMGFSPGALQWDRDGLCFITAKSGSSVTA